MHLRIVVVLLALAGIVLLLRWIMRTPAETIARHIRRFGVIVAVGALLYLAASGRLHWLFALLGSLLPFARRMIGFLRYAPILRQLFQQFASARTNSKQQGTGDSRHRHRRSGAMSREEAASILEIPENASKETIVAAHRKLMQKLHPDRGGSTYLASQINKAKEVLLRPD